MLLSKVSPGGRHRQWSLRNHRAVHQQTDRQHHLCCHCQPFWLDIFFFAVNTHTVSRIRGWWIRPPCAQLLCVATLWLKGCRNLPLVGPGESPLVSVRCAGVDCCCGKCRRVTVSSSQSTHIQSPREGGGFGPRVPNFCALRPCGLGLS